MRRYILAIIIVLLGSNTYGQSESFNCVLLIDNDINIGTINEVRFGIFREGDMISSLAVDYNFGNLEFDKDSLERFFDTTYKIFLSINYSIKDRNDENRKYQIPFDPDYLNERFFILKIYNTDVNCNRKVFTALPNKKYNYEILSPTYSFQLVRKGKSRCK